MCILCIMDLAEYKNLVISKTQIPSPDKTIWAKTSKLCMLYVEFRYMDIIRHNLNNICNVYGGGDVSLVILHSGDNRDIIMETTKDWVNVKYIQAFEKNVPVAEYDKMFTSYNFWNKFSEFDHVLTNSWDSYIFRRIPERFFKYDIVGGPSGHFYSVFNNHIINVCSKSCKCERCVNGDHPFKEDKFKDHPTKWFLLNGGFYLRNVKAVKELCRNKPWNGEPDDVYFAISDLSRPSREEAKEFGIQDFKSDGPPVGCHKVWENQDEEYVLKLFNEYLKM